MGGGLRWGRWLVTVSRAAARVTGPVSAGHGCECATGGERGQGVRGGARVLVWVHGSRGRGYLLLRGWHRWGGQPLGLRAWWGWAVLGVGVCGRWGWWLAAVSRGAARVTGPVRAGYGCECATGGERRAGCVRRERRAASAGWWACCGIGTCGVAGARWGARGRVCALLRGQHGRGQHGRAGLRCGRW